jgi:hypothetical protein
MVAYLHISIFLPPFCDVWSILAHFLDFTWASRSIALQINVDSASVLRAHFRGGDASRIMVSIETRFAETQIFGFSTTMLPL